MPCGQGGSGVTVFARGGGVPHPRGESDSLDAQSLTLLALQFAAHQNYKAAQVYDSAAKPQNT